MKTFIVLALDTRRPKADGTCATLLRIIHHGLSSQITTGIYVKEQDWDKKARIIKSSHKGTMSVARLNNMLQKKKTEATDIINKLDEKKTLDTFTVHQLKELLERKSESSSFFAFGDTLVKNLTETNRLGSARAYRCVLSVLKKLNGGKDLSFREITTAEHQYKDIQRVRKKFNKRLKELGTLCKIEDDLTGFSFWLLLLHFVWKSIGNNWKFPGKKWKKPGNFWKKQPFFGNFSAKLEISHNLIKHL